jgi:hypothetical protein
MKVLQKIIISFIIWYGVFWSIQVTHADIFDVTTWWMQSNWEIRLETGQNPNSNNIKHNKLEEFKSNNPDVWTTSISKNVWELGIRNVLVTIARDLKNLFFYLASLYLLIMILILLFSDKTEEASNNLKKWVLWVSLWLIVTQIAYMFIDVLFWTEVSERLAEEFAQKIFQPFIWLLEAAASFFFIAIAIYAFYKLVTSNGNEDDAKSGKMSIVYAIVWFIVIKITKTMVNTIYWKVDCEAPINSNIFDISTNERARCLWDTKISESAQIIVDIINWANWFIWIIVVLLIIYTWAKVLLSAWDEETLKKAKSSMLYIAIGLWLLVMNYMILTFFILPESPIV